MAAAAAAARAARQTAPSLPDGEWRSYGRDLANSRYSPLALITRDNVSSLKVAWRWRSDNFSTPPEARNESTPLMVGGTLYFTSGATRWVIAADAVTGATKWAWHLDEGERARHAPRRDSGRGVAYWTDGHSERILTVTPGFNLAALDAKTGLPVQDFGDHGVVDLKANLGVALDPVTAAIGSSSPPLVFGDLAVIGPALEVGTRPPSKKNVPGRIMAFDVRTGALKWRFDTIPQKDEAGYETWEDGSADYTGNAGAWAPLTLDEARGYLYLPVEAPTGDYYGGHRHGANLFANSLVCLDITTGKRIWSYQIVHHDIWDRDNPAAPMLTSATIGGRKVDLVVQITKQAFAYVFDRVTGTPVWPITEQAVPQTDVPGEQTSATQPMPSKPKAFDRQGVTADDFIDFTPALHAEAVAAAKSYRLGQLWTPPSVSDGADSTHGTLMLPGILGGANWEGGAVDPETGMLYVPSWTSLALLGLAKDPQHSDMDFVGGAGGRLPTVRGLPIVKPPYSRITAIDLNTGDHAWMVVNGDTPAEIKNNAALAGLTIPPTGAQTRPVVLATKTLLFNGEGYRAAPVLRALDKQTGATLASIALPGSIGSVPMTYSVNGRQFIAMWVSDPASDLPATLIALAIPAPGGRGRGGAASADPAGAPAGARGPR